MATREELIQKALAEMELATWNPKRWAKAILNSDPEKPYNYPATHNFRAAQYLWEASRTNPNIGAGSDNYLAPVRNVLFLTGDTSEALECKHYLLCATADLGYRHFYSQSFIQDAIEQDRFRVWCDCRESPNGTPPEIALEWLRQLGLPSSYFYGQCENADEFDRAYAAGARLMVGKVDGITPKQLQLIANKKVMVVNETYYNVQPDLIPNWKNANAGIGGNAIATYESSTDGATYLSVQSQIDSGKFILGRDSVYVADFRGSDWQTLRW